MASDLRRPRAAARQVAFSAAPSSFAAAHWAGAASFSQVQPAPQGQWRGRLAPRRRSRVTATPQHHETEMMAGGPELATKEPDTSAELQEAAAGKNGGDGLKHDLGSDLMRWISSDNDTVYKFTLVGSVLVTALALALQPDALPDTVAAIPPVIEQPPPPSMIDNLMAWASTPTTMVSGALAISAFTQAVCGFGFAIVSVGLLTQIPWIVNSSLFNDIQPVAAIVGAFVGSVLILPEVNKIRWKPLLPLIVSSCLAAPIGGILVEYVNAGSTLHGIGAMILGFVAYSASGIALPAICATRPAAVVFGALAGLLGGAFDIQGPPLVFYANAKKWEPEEFRRNILAVIIINSLIVAGVDAATGRLESFYVLEFIRCSFPGVVGAIIAGRLVGSRLDSGAFKNIILIICGLMGAKLLTG